MTKGALVIGGSVAGVQAALDLANSGIDVHLVEKGRSLEVERGVDVSGLPDEAVRFLLTPKLLSAASHPHVRLYTGTEVTAIHGERGDFQIKMHQKPRYVDTQRCMACNRCSEVCTVDIPGAAGSGWAAHKAIHPPAPHLRSVPSAYTIEKKGIAPCRLACPGGINIQGYLALISRGRFAESLALIREAVPIPGVLGRVCTRPCEGVCNRATVDEPVAICSLKRFVADEETASGEQSALGFAPVTGKPHVAIIGSGPAGLTAAWELAQLGHGSTIFEALPVAGGMLAAGIPEFRLPREGLKAEIDRILDKISEHGLKSLTPEEERILDEASHRRDRD